MSYYATRPEDLCSLKEYVRLKLADIKKNKVKIKSKKATN